MIHLIRRLFAIVLFLNLLASCTTDPVAGDFAAPKFGKVTVDTEAFRARISCPVNGDLSGISDYGIRFETPLKQGVSATLSDGMLQVEMKALTPETDYRTELYMSNGSETITQPVSFRTEAGPEAVEIPDPVFRRYLLDHFDANEDDVLTVEEAVTIFRIEVNADSISSLKGIEKMTRLQELIARGTESHGRLSKVDLSGNPLLRVCALDDNQISTIDLSGLPMLEEFGIGGNPLQEIDFSHNPRLGSIGMNNVPIDHLPDMTFLPLWSLHFDHVARFIDENYLRNFPRMVGTNIGFYEGQRIDLSRNTQLISLWAYGCPNLEELDFTASDRFCELFVNDCPQLHTVKVRAGTVFERLEKDPHTKIVYVE